MTVQLIFEFETAEIHKSPITIKAEAAVLLPDAGDVVEAEDGSRHIVNARVFDWSENPGPSVLLLCVRAENEVDSPFYSGEDPGELGITEDE